MEETRGKLSILACESGKPLAEKIYKILVEKASHKEIKFIKSEEIRFANSEIKTIIKESIRNADVYVIQDAENAANGYSIDENLRALKTAIDAAWRNDVRYITAVLPVFPYARQDKTDTREGITAAAIAREIENEGANHIITLDVHNTAIAGFFRKARFENLKASKNIIQYIKQAKDLFDLKNLVVMSPDLGGAKRAEHYAQKLHTNLVFAYKKRDYTQPNVVEDLVILGDIKGKDVLLVDDMVCTGGTLMKVVKLAKEKGANKVFAACSLPLFNGEAVEKISKAFKNRYLTALIGTDAVYHGENFSQKNPWFKEVSVASYFAKVIYNMNHFQSISELLK